MGFTPLIQIPPSIVDKGSIAINTCKNNNYAEVKGTVSVNSALNGAAATAAGPATPAPKKFMLIELMNRASGRHRALTHALVVSDQDKEVDMGAVEGQISALEM